MSIEHGEAQIVPVYYDSYRSSSRAIRKGCGCVAKGGKMKEVDDTRIQGLKKEAIQIEEQRSDAHG